MRSRLVSDCEIYTLFNKPNFDIFLLVIKFQLARGSLLIYVDIANLANTAV